MRRREGSRRRAGGSILPHKPGNWQTADGQVHFPPGVSGLRYGRATPFLDGGGRVVSWRGRRRRVAERMSTWPLESFPSPSLLRLSVLCNLPLS